MRTKAERTDRWERCIEYLRKHGSIPDAQKAAHVDGFACNTSVWVTALSKMLERGQRPGQ